MAFGKGRQQRSQEQTTFQPVYLKLSEGERIVRIIDHEPTEYWRYWLSGPRFTNLGKGRSIVVGKNGPIRQFMDAIGEEDPAFRKVQHRNLLNVLDRTPVKKTQKGVVVYANGNGKFPSTFEDEDITTQVIAPNDQVLVLDYGATLADAFDMLHENVRGRTTGEPLPLWLFDVKIMTRGTGTDVTRMVLPHEEQGPLPDNLFALSKYDLAAMCRPMPDAAQERVLNGDDYAAIIKDLGWDRPQAVVPQF